MPFWIDYTLSIWGLKSEVGQIPDLLPKTDQMIEELDKGSLKPQQRFYSLNTRLFPSLLKLLTFMSRTKKFLKSLVLLRLSRGGSRFPDIWQKSLTHTNVQLGGLGIRQLVCRIPSVEAGRIEKFCGNGDEFAAQINGALPHLCKKMKHTPKSPAKSQSLLNAKHNCTAEAL